jgi:hypothetical protein
MDGFLAYIYIIHIFCNLKTNAHEKFKLPACRGVIAI